MIIEGAEAFIPLMENAAKAEGTKIGKFVTLPATAQDYAPQVAEATSGDADCLVMIVSETPYIAWMPAFAQSGSEARMYGPQGNFNENAVKGFEEVVEGDVNAGMYPDISTAAWADYRAALDEYEADSAQDYNSLGGMGTWAAYEGFKQVVESMGERQLDNETFLKAAETRSDRPPGHGPAAGLRPQLGQRRRAGRLRPPGQPLRRLQRIQRRQARPARAKNSRRLRNRRWYETDGLRTALRLIRNGSYRPRAARPGPGPRRRLELGPKESTRGRSNPIRAVGPRHRRHYALASQGLIIIYRGSGVLNFALGAIGMAGAYVWWELTANQGWAFLPGARRRRRLLGGHRRPRPPLDHAAAAPRGAAGPRDRDARRADHDPGDRRAALHGDLEVRPQRPADGHRPHPRARS